MEIWVFTGMGFFLIFCGFLVKKYPNLIAGYNQRSAEERERVDIEGLSAMMKRNFIGMGIGVMWMAWLFHLLDYHEYSVWGFIGIILIGSGTILVRAQSYEKRP